MLNKENLFSLTFRPLLEHKYTTELYITQYKYIIELMNKCVLSVKDQEGWCQK